MYHPTTRLLTILELLQSYPSLTGVELARRLEVNPRSVRRYILMLQDLGIPVDSTRGRYGSYHLRPGFKLPPLMFTDEEVFALTVGLLALPRLGLVFATPAVEGALAKIQRVLPAALRMRVQAMQGVLALETPQMAVRPESKLVALFTEAAQQSREAWIRYRSTDSQETERTIEPYGVAQWSRYWYVVGYCHLRGGLRMFRLDRVIEARVEDRTFSPREEVDCLEYVIRSIATMPGTWQVEVVLNLSMEEARRRIPAAYGTLEPLDEGVLFRCHYDDLDGMARYLVSLGCPLTVRRPAELRAAMRRLAAQIVTVADGAE